MIKVIQELCAIEQAYITTVHSYTTDQSLHDQPHKDLRRARGAAQSIVPTTTGAAKALTKIFPSLDGKIGVCGIRVTVADGSLTDITFNVKRKVTIAEINLAFKNAAAAVDNALEYISTQRATFGSQMNRLSYVSSNLQAQSTNLQNSRSAIVDTDFAAETAKLTKGQIMQQAATAMLAQANQMPNVILSLLK
jgi:glyceraldehyde-3-phosphate dehydrogenase type I